jgi:aspartyl-tRNA(Asn)/glutamyl-tRNA(Gln) amidotransferase subunit B
MPELPCQVRERYLALGLSQYDVVVLSDELPVAAYFDAVLAAGAAPKPSANWVMGDVMAHCKEARMGMDQLGMSPGALAEMIGLIEDGTISGKIGKEVLPALLAGEGGAGGGSVRALVEARGLVQISDPAALQAIVDGVLDANPKQLQQYREGAREQCANLALPGGTAASWHRGFGLAA